MEELRDKETAMTTTPEEEIVLDEGEPLLQPDASEPQEDHSDDAA